MYFKGDVPFESDIIGNIYNHNNLNWDASDINEPGLPATWTNSPYGDHYWKVEMDINCCRVNEFPVKAYMTYDFESYGQWLGVYCPDEFHDPSDPNRNFLARYSSFSVHDAHYLNHIT